MSVMNVIHGFTNDRAALASAVRLALNGTGAELAAASANVLNETDYTFTGGPGGVSLNPGIDVTQTPDFSSERRVHQSTLRVAGRLAALITNQRGMADLIGGMRTWEALLQIIRYEAALPGRKTILYLSDGLVEPPGRQDFVRTGGQRRQSRQCDLLLHRCPRLDAHDLQRGQRGAGGVGGRHQQDTTNRAVLALCRDEAVPAVRCDGPGCGR